MLKCDVDRAVVILDNHTAHKAEDVVDYCEGCGLKLLFLPPYASEFNAVELVWAQFKRIWGQLIYRKCLDPELPNPASTKAAVRNVVKEALLEVVRSCNFTRLSRGRVRMMLKALLDMRVRLAADTDSDDSE